MDVELIALDLDGTLVDSAPDLCHCLGAALEAVGLPAPSEAQTRGWVGGGIELLIRRALVHTAGPSAVEDGLLPTALGAFLACYAQNLYAQSRLYPGVAATLETLRARGLALHCITNKRLDFAEGLLEQAGIREHLESVLGGDSLPQKKPHPLPLTTVAEAAGVAPARALMVGDSNQDLHAARGAGFRFAWATYGYCKELDPTAAPPELRLDRFADLPKLLAG